MDAHALALRYTNEVAIVTDAEKVMAEAVQKRDGTLSVLRERLKAGESTGDIARDLMFLQDGSPLSSIEEYYRKLQQKISGQVGKVIVYAEKTRKPYDSNEFDSPIMDPGIDSIYAGVLTSGVLEVDQQYAVAKLPMNEHLFYAYSDLQRIDPGSVWARPPFPHPAHSAGGRLYIGDEIHILYEAHRGFRTFVLENKRKPILAWLPGLPVPKLSLTHGW